MKKELTRGHKSSERKAVYHATFIGLLMAFYGIYEKVDLTDLATLIFAVLTPLSLFYPASRTIVKASQGEQPK